MKKWVSMLMSVILIMAFSTTSFAAEPKSDVSLIENPKGNKCVDVSTGVGAISSGAAIGNYAGEEFEKPATDLRAALELFQVKEVRAMPAYLNPEDNMLYYNTFVYVRQPLDDFTWGQTNYVSVPTENTEKLIEAFKNVTGYEANYWYFEMDCYVQNYSRPHQFVFDVIEGGGHITEPAKNGTTRFTLIFPRQYTTEPYTNGFRGTFSYYSSTGKLVELMAAGAVTFNAK